MSSLKYGRNGDGAKGARQFGTNMTNAGNVGRIGADLVKNENWKVGGAKKRPFEHKGLADGAASARPQKKPRLNPSDFRSRTVEDERECKHYLDEIIENLWKLEKEDDCKATANYMDRQDNIKPRMRGILVDWLIEVHNKFKLRPSTMFLTIELLDRYLSRRNIHRTKLQLLGCTCMWIASKYHEIYCPQINDFVYISDNAFNRQNLLRMETEVCIALDFKLTVPTPETFMDRFIQVYKYDLPTKAQKNRLVMMTQYIVERALMTYDLVGEERSKIAAASLYLAIERLKYGSWNYQMEQVTTYSEADLSHTVGILREIVNGVRGRSHKAVVHKYSRAKRAMVSKIRDKPNRRERVRN